MALNLLANVHPGLARNEPTLGYQGYNTYGVDFLTTHITQGRLTPTLGYQRYNAFSVELQWYYKQRNFTR